MNAVYQRHPHQKICRCGYWMHRITTFQFEEGQHVTWLCMKCGRKVEHPRKQLRR